MSTDCDAPPQTRRPVGEWLRRNLFGSWTNGLLTVLGLWIVYRTAVPLVRWGVVDAAFGRTPEACLEAEGACWAVIADLWPVFLVGLYPAEARWRVAVAAVLIVALALAASWRRARRARAYHIAWAILPVPVFLLIRGSETLGLPLVDTSLWGGLMLTLIIAATGQIVAFPISLLLALGRRSRTMPIARLVCVAFIELVRSVPLVTILIMVSIMLPLFSPAGTTIDQLWRAQVGIIVFSAATLAEVVRGGLQGVPRGQEEAAAAIGLHTWQTMLVVVLPQALRLVIPALVGTFINFVKGTSLVAVVGLFDLLGTAMLASANPQWVGRVTEPLLFAAALFWVICYAMSKYSRRLEVKYRVGQF